MSIDFQEVRKHLEDFRFDRVFVEVLGWSRPKSSKAVPFRAGGVDLKRTAIAELAGVTVFEVTAEGAVIPDRAVRMAAHKTVAAHHHEHLLVFVDPGRTQSLWSWLLRDGKREDARTHLYVKGQPGDLFIGKLASMVFDLSELDTAGNVPLVEVTARLRKALDVERVTKRFYEDFQKQHAAFLGEVEGIRDEREKRWYVSVLLNRLMFIYFLQRKSFVDGDVEYLRHKLAETQREGADLYYERFLKVLFFEGFAVPEDERSAEAKKRLGRIRYLNGGLFLKHRIELENPDIRVPDRAFESLFALFERYTWNLDDTPRGKADEINPDVLGYIFEKYINQKHFGAYYTRPELTAYLCEETIYRHVLDRVNEEAIPNVPGSGPGGSLRNFKDIEDMVLHLDAKLCSKLLREVLPQIKVLDPACGSGAFLVAAMKTLLDLYGALVGRAKVLASDTLKADVAQWEKDHPSLGYFLKKQIITQNLHGVDLMEEATEIARLRLFLALVASATKEEDLEPLPNIDFNVMPGNSLVGLIDVSEEAVKRHALDHGNLLLTSYAKVVAQKNARIKSYREAAGYDRDLTALRENIDRERREVCGLLDEMLLENFRDLGIRHEQPTWDDKKNDVGKSEKRALRIGDIRALRPFHWGYEFADVMRERKGFDIILANPPWEVFKPEAKEFFQEYSDFITKNNMRIEDFEKEQEKLLKKPAVRKAWLEYLARFPHVNDYFRSASQYRNQISVVGGKKAGTDINLYKLFVEQCLNLLKPEGQLGLVVPGSLYSDLGAKQLRATLFENNTLRALFGFSNERYLFEGVHHSFKICLLVATREGVTDRFEAAFRINPREAVNVENIASFLRDRREHIEMTTELVRRTSPDSLSVMEFKSATDVAIVEKMLKSPLLGKAVEGCWSVELCREFHMTDDSGLFKNKPGDGRVPLYEGKGIHQFNLHYAEPRYWVDREEAREAVGHVRLRRAQDAAKAAGAELDEVSLKRLSLDCDAYRLGFRKYARNTDERTMIATVVAQDSFAGESLTLHRPIRDTVLKGKLKEVPTLTEAELLFVVAMLNSFSVDWFLRLRVSSTINMFYVYQLPVPRLTAGDARFGAIVKRAARLTCTTPEFDALAKAVKLKSHKDGATHPEERDQLRAEIDGLVAHLYGLTEEEFAHVVRTFPVVHEAVRVGAMNAYRAVARGDVT
jgi:hypothetical protein